MLQLKTIGKENIRTMNKFIEWLNENRFNYDIDKNYYIRVQSNSKGRMPQAIGASTLKRVGYKFHVMHWHTHSVTFKPTKEEEQ